MKWVFLTVQGLDDIALSDNNAMNDSEEEAEGPGMGEKSATSI